MNPDVFIGRSDQLILSTLVHEMAHVWQQSHGTPPRRCYHDKEWAGKMKEIGLQPSPPASLAGRKPARALRTTSFLAARLLMIPEPAQDEQQEAA